MSEPCRAAGDRPSVLVVIDRPSLARWVSWLTETLENDVAARVGIALDDGAPAGEDVAALRTLLVLEGMVLRRGRPCGADRLDPAALERHRVPARTSAFDIVIDLGAGPPAEAAGSAPVYRPLFDGRPGEASLAAALFFEGPPQIAIERRAAGSEPRIVAGGVASLEAAAGIGGAMEATWTRVIALIVKALTATGPAGEEAAAPAPARTGRLTHRHAAAHTARALARRAARAAYHLCCYPSHWRIGWRRPAPGEDVWSRGDLAGEPWRVLADPVDHFYADPFVKRWQGRDHLFFEDYDHKTGKGLISVASFDAAGRPGAARPVLEEPWHLSYPFLLEWAGALWMIPESAASGAVTLYRAVDFPLRWERHATLIDGVEAADATIVAHDGRLWMFAVVRKGRGGYSDTLAIWSANDLFGPWEAHPANPVLVDDRSARPAGAMRVRGGTLWRPVQDCRRTYGGALSLMRVTRLDRETFAQRRETTLEAGGPWPGGRVHTLNADAGLEAIDGFVLRPRLKAAADRVDRWYRPPGADDGR